MSIAIKVEGISKKYLLGRTSSADLRHTINSYLNKIRSKKPKLDKREFWALKDVSFEVSEGEVLGIIGRNGAGKSTLLKILSRITPPTKGHIELNGRVASLLEVGTGFHPELTGRENIFLNGALLGMRREEIKRKFDDIVSFSGVEQFIDTPVKRYSSGMYVRLAFAVAAHLEAEILLIDEVLAVGDLEFQKKCLGKMDSVAKSGRTVLFVSHNLSAISKICRNALIINNGTIVYQDTPQKCIEYYFDFFKNQSTIALVNRKDRSGDKNIKFTSINILNKQGDKISYIHSGQLIIVELSYSSCKAIIEDLIVRLEFVNTYGELLFICNNRVFPGVFENIPGKGILRCQIPKIPLNTGKYYINLIGKVNRKNSDAINAAIEFNVEKGFFYPTGNLPRAQSSLLVNYNWTQS